MRPERIAERPLVSDYIGVGVHGVQVTLAYRFALFAASTVVLSVLWGRFALQSWPG